jgi:hypothetical protein
MTEFDSSTAVFSGKPEQLSRMVNLDRLPADAWKENDLPAIFRHQLAAALDFDLHSMKLSATSAKSRDEALATAGALQIVSFSDLFFHPEPPLKLLKLAKDFFKRQAGASEQRRPGEQVAYVMYVISVMVARIRLENRITKLKDREFQPAVQWCINRPWVDEPVKELLREAGGRLSVGPPQV